MSTSDLSRESTDLRKRYAGVRMQQGRVLTDDDFNESARLANEDARRTRIDTIGAYGSPDNGFLPNTIANLNGKPNFKLSAGTLYLGGLRLDLLADEAYQLQKDWLTFNSADLNDWPNAPAAGQTRTDLVWIEAWQQTVTAVEDSELFEVALGGPDTSTRERVQRRVHILPNIGTNVCSKAWQTALAGWSALGSFTKENELASNARLKVTFTAPSSGGDLCSPAAAGGYLGAENQAIRVQVIDNGHYTWGFDNGAPLYRAILSSEGGQRIKLKLITPPKDAVHWPLKDQVIELLPWSAALANGERLAEQSGVFIKAATSYNPDTQEFNLVSAPPTGFDTHWQGRADVADFYHSRVVNGEDQQNFIYVRVWNRGDDLSSPSAIPFSTPVLGDTGLSVSFTGTPQISDYWIIAARPAAPNAVTPWILTDASGAAPFGVKRYRAPLALITWLSDGSIKLYDCRPSFKPLVKQRCCIELVAKPGLGWEQIFDQIPSLSDAKICFPSGEYPVTNTVIVAGKGRLQLVGNGPTSKLNGNTLSSVLQFQNADAVSIENLYILGGNNHQKGFAGTLSFSQVNNIELDKVSVRNKSGRHREVACVKVNNAFLPKDIGRVSIKNSNFYIGHLQVGLVLLNTHRTVLRDNRFVASGSTVESVQLALRSDEFRAHLARVAITTTPASNNQAQMIHVPSRTESQSITLYTDEALHAFWLSFVKNDKRVINFTPQQVGILRVHLMERFQRILKTHASRNRFANLKSWLGTIDASAQSFASQAIVIAGRKAEQIIIEGNEIERAAQGVHIGLSHKTNARTAAEADTAVQISIRQNRIRCVLGAGGPVERHGIFIGNAQSITIFDNYITLERLAGLRHLATDGVRIFGFAFSLAVIRANYFAGFSNSVNVVTRGRVNTSAILIDQDNYKG